MQQQQQQQQQKNYDLMMTKDTVYSSDATDSLQASSGSECESDVVPYDHHNHHFSNSEDAMSDLEESATDGESALVELPHDSVAALPVGPKKPRTSALAVKIGVVVLLGCGAVAVCLVVFFVFFNENNHHGEASQGAQVLVSTVPGTQHGGQGTESTTPAADPSQTTTVGPVPVDDACNVYATAEACGGACAWLQNRCVTNRCVVLTQDVCGKNTVRMGDAPCVWGSADTFRPPFLAPTTTAATATGSSPDDSSTTTGSGTTTVAMYCGVNPCALIRNKEDCKLANKNLWHPTTSTGFNCTWASNSSVCGTNATQDACGANPSCSWSADTCSEKASEAHCFDAALATKTATTSSSAPTPSPATATTTVAPWYAWFSTYTGHVVEGIVGVLVVVAAFATYMRRRSRTQLSDPTVPSQPATLEDNAFDVNRELDSSAPDSLATVEEDADGNMVTAKQEREYQDPLASLKRAIDFLNTPIDMSHARYIQNTTDVTAFQYQQAQEHANKLQHLDVVNSLEKFPIENSYDHFSPAEKQQIEEFHRLHEQTSKLSFFEG